MGNDTDKTTTDMSTTIAATTATSATALTRRRALARLGLGVLVAYAAPTITRLDREAMAAKLPSPGCLPGSKFCGGGKKRRKRNKKQRKRRGKGKKG